MSAKLELIVRLVRPNRIRYRFRTHSRGCRCIDTVQGLERVDILENDGGLSRRSSCPTYIAVSFTAPLMDMRILAHQTSRPLSSLGSPVQLNEEFLT
jgi:hypothetical protein